GPPSRPGSRSKPLAPRLWTRRVINGGSVYEARNRNTTPNRAATSRMTRGFTDSVSKLHNMPAPAAWSSIKCLPKWRIELKDSRGNMLRELWRSLLRAAINEAGNTISASVMNRRRHERYELSEAV